MRIFLRLWMLLCLSGTAWAMDDVLVPEEGPSIASEASLCPASCRCIGMRTREGSTGY